MRSWGHSARIVWVVSALLITTILAASTHASMINVMPLGDTITIGGSATHNGGYRYPLWNLIKSGPNAGTIDFVGSESKGPGNFDADHEGHSGNTIDETIANTTKGTTIEGWLGASTPDVILLHIGTVNAYHNSPSQPLDAISDLEVLVDRIFTFLPGVELYLLSIIGTADDSSSSFSTYVNAYNAALPALVAEEQHAGNDITFVDMFNGAGLIYGVGSPDFTDLVHPSDAGYDKMAQFLHSQVFPNIKPEPTTLTLFVMGLSLFLARRQAGRSTWIVARSTVKHMG